MNVKTKEIPHDSWIEFQGLPELFHCSQSDAGSSEPSCHQECCHCYQSRAVSTQLSSPNAMGAAKPQPDTSPSPQVLNSKPI